MIAITFLFVIGILIEKCFLKVERLSNSSSIQNSNSVSISSSLTTEII